MTVPFDQASLDAAFQRLDDELDRMDRGEDLPLSPSLLEASRRALATIGTLESIDEWAARLAAEAVAIDDQERPTFIEGGHIDRTGLAVLDAPCITLSREAASIVSAHSDGARRVRVYCDLRHKVWDSDHMPTFALCCDECGDGVNMDEPLVVIDADGDGRS